MPELPEVETTRRGIAPHIEQQTIRSVTLRHHQLRWPIPEDLPTFLPKQRVESVERRGKYLLLRCTKGTLIWHLGMSGSLRLVKPEEPDKLHDHIDILLNNDWILRYHDPRRFGALLWTEEDPLQHDLIKHLGPEPLEEAFTADYLFQRSRKKQQAVKTWLMDSKVVVGVGNIYANEALFDAGIRPTKAAGKLTKAACERLHEAVRRILASAIEQGGTTLRDFVGGDGKPGYFAQTLKVYGRGGEPCVVCGRTLKEERLGQRSTVYCRACQK